MRRAATSSPASISSNSCLPTVQYLCNISAMLRLVSCLAMYESCIRFRFQSHLLLIATYWTFAARSDQFSSYPMQSNTFAPRSKMSGTPIDKIVLGRRYGISGCWRGCLLSCGSVADRRGEWGRHGGPRGPVGFSLSLPLLSKMTYARKNLRS